MNGDTSTGTTGKISVLVGALAVIGATVTYWLVLPGVVFGGAAIWLGVRDRKRGLAEVGSVAITLGVVAVLLVPAVLWVADEAGDWARMCALDPSADPNC